MRAVPSSPASTRTIVEPLSTAQPDTEPLPAHVETRGVPPTALAISVLALAAAAAINLAWRDALPQYSALVWLLALIPPFLLAYHRGWRGAALALAAGMLILLGVEIGVRQLTGRPIQWWFVGGLISVLIVVSLGVGAVAEILRRKTEDALQMAYEDPLTGLPNRRVLEMFLAKEFAAAQRGGRLSVVIFDIDGFKRYNDRRGHAAGDEALRLVGRVLEHNTRAMNLSGRYGGDEFLALLPQEGAEGAAYFAERVRKGMAESALAVERDLSVSVGVAEFDPDMASPGDLVEAADRALYAAKRDGGNRVVLNPGRRPPTEFDDHVALVMTEEEPSGS